MKNKHNAIMGFLIGILGTAIPSFFIMKLQQNSISRWKDQANKDRGLFLLMNQWTNIKQDGRNLETYFIKNGYKNIAIYGMGHIGLRLAQELRDSDIEVSYGIDRNASNIYSDVRVITLEDELATVDAVVVTAITAFDEIYDALINRLKCPIIAIEDILNEI